VHNTLAIVNIAIIVILLGATWWFAQSTSRILKQSQDQVTALQQQAIAKIEELQFSYAQTLQEIEERQQAEDRLKESEEAFAAFMEHLPGTATIRDTAGRFLFANEIWEKYFGRQHLEWLDETPAGTWPPERVNTLPELDQQVLDRQMPLESVETLDYHGQTHFWLVNHFPILNREDQATMVGAVGIDITARRCAEEALRLSEQKLRSLAAQLLSAQEKERKRLAAELHDELGHALLTLKLRLESLEEQLQPQQESLKEEVQKILGFISETIGDVRRLYLDLSPGDLEDLGLTTALNSLVDDFGGLHQKIDWAVKLDNIDGLFPLPVQTTIYRIMQEALTNIGKHADPNHVNLTVTKEDEKVFFVIKDDGKGFDRNKISLDKNSLGLLSIEERIKILGGDFEIWSQENQGVRISFTIPIAGGGKA
jgi:PAS domain S-box-containing protein